MATPNLFLAQSLSLSLILSLANCLSLAHSLKYLEEDITSRIVDNVPLWEEGKKTQR